MSDLIEIKPSNYPYVSITWQVNNFCNFRCSYCNEGNWSGSFKNDDQQDKLIDNLSKIVDFYKSQGYVNFKVFFSGGEPTLWKGLLPISKFLKKTLGVNVTLGINTNFSRKLTWWEKNWGYFDDVVASYHPEFAKYDTFLENAKFLQTRINYLCLRIMVMEEKFEEVKEVGKRLKESLDNYNLEWVPLLKEMSTGAVPWNYNNPEITEFLSTNNFETKTTAYKPNLPIDISSLEVYSDGTTKVLNSNRLVAENRNFFKGWKCNVNESIFISPSGNVRAASCGQGPQLGNIFGDISFPVNSVICKKDYCHCGTDIQISKHK